MSRVISQYRGTDVTLVDILENRVTDECLAVFNTNGTMIKTQKSKLLQSFVFAPLDFTDLQNNTAVVDMGFSGDQVCPPLKIDRKETKRSTHGQIMLIRFLYHYEPTIEPKNGDICQRIRLMLSIQQKQRNMLEEIAFMEVKIFTQGN